MVDLLHTFYTLHIRINHIHFFWPVSPHVHYGLGGLPSRLRPKCNRLMRMGRTWGAVTLTRWGGWWYIHTFSSTKLPDYRAWSPCESSPSRKNSHGRTGNRNRGLMISSHKLWPLDHEAGPNHKYNYLHFPVFNVSFISCIIFKI
jgi:hypothetical protein